MAALGYGLPSGGLPPPMPGGLAGTGVPRPMGVAAGMAGQAGAAGAVAPADAACRSGTVSDTDMADATVETAAGASTGAAGAARGGEQAAAAHHHAHYVPAAAAGAAGSTAASVAHRDWRPLSPSHDPRHFEDDRVALSLPRDRFVASDPVAVQPSGTVFAVASGDTRDNQPSDTGVGMTPLAEMAPGGPVEAVTGMGVSGEAADLRR
jgi:hypothetical protein